MRAEGKATETQRAKAFMSGQQEGQKTPWSV